MKASAFAKTGTLVRLTVALLAVALPIAKPAVAADVRVMISAGFFEAYSQLGPAFERASGHRLVTTRGPSMGDSPEAIPARLACGEPADVVIMDGASADVLAKRGLVRADTKVELALSQIGMVVRAGDAKPDIGSIDAFKRALLAAKSIAYSDSGSGTYLSTTLFAKLGVAEQVAGKSRKVRGPPSGEPVAAVVARGEAEIGFQQVSELIRVPGVTFVGAIPAELQPGFSFAGSITVTSSQPEAARALLRFLAAPEAAATITKAGLAPVPAVGREARQGERHAAMDAATGVTRADQGKGSREHRVIPLRPMSGDVELLYGDPDVPGEPFVMRIRELAGTIIPPHSHPVDEHITVLKGTWNFGFGTAFDDKALAELKPGAYAFAPKGSTMFGFAPEESIVQVHGVGPFEIHWLRGLKTLDDADAKTNFKYVRDQRVTCARGSGRIVEGYGSGPIIQYVIEQANGGRFMASEADLRLE